MKRDFITSGIWRSDHDGFTAIRRDALHRSGPARKYDDIVLVPASATRSGRRRTQRLHRATVGPMRLTSPPAKNPIDDPSGDQNGY